MRPSDEQIKQLMTTVACAACGAPYDPTNIEVLGHRDELWFLRVSCIGCMTSGLIAAMVKSSDDPASPPAWPAPEPEPIDDSLDRASAPGPVTRSDVQKMRAFLRDFDGNFSALFAHGPSQPAA